VAKREEAGSTGKRRPCWRWKAGTQWTRACPLRRPTAQPALSTPAQSASTGEHVTLLSSQVGGMNWKTGTTLCQSCHREPHVVFNGRPDVASPLGAEW